MEKRGKRARGDDVACIETTAIKQKRLLQATASTDMTTGSSKSYKDVEKQWKAWRKAHMSNRSCRAYLSLIGEQPRNQDAVPCPHCNQNSFSDVFRFESLPSFSCASAPDFGARLSTFHSQYPQAVNAETSHWKARCLSGAGMPDVVVIRGVLDSSHQAYWVKRSIRDYPLQPKFNTNMNAEDEARLKSGGTATAPWWVDESPFQQKLRWVTCGYNYDWTNRKYDVDDFVPLPDDLTGLYGLILSYIGFNPCDREAQTAIVNFYHEDSVMGGHRDDAEEHLEAPVMSVSLGASCIFLIGDEHTKDIEPASCLLTSGDVVLIGGDPARLKSGRLRYHGVPCVLGASANSCGMKDQFGDDKTEASIYKYISGGRRVNINVRQVYSTMGPS